MNKVQITAEFIKEQLLTGQRLSDATMVVFRHQITDWLAEFIVKNELDNITEHELKDALFAAMYATPKAFFMRIFAEILTPDTN
ncbi:MAG: hypothetical protein U9O54_06985 [Chloroflexota bacterium]|nr:hypothetical protein [Chloroflexota bacterium]